MNENKRQILLVENEPYLQQTLVQALNVAFNGDVDVQVCTNSETALSMAKLREYDLLITEHSLPRVSGSELIARIRQTQPELPAILLSNFASDMMSTSTLNMLNGFITKPFELTKLFKMVQHVMKVGSTGSSQNGNGLMAAPAPVEQKTTSPKNNLTEAAVSANTKKQPKILIVEDDTGLLFIYRKALTKAGYEIYLASNIAEAKALLDQDTYDIFICDIQLGRERGTDLVEQYGEEISQKGTQIIMVSAFGQYRHITKDLGVDFFLEKPISLNTLITMIERLTNKYQFEEAAAYNGAAANL